MEDGTVFWYVGRGILGLGTRDVMAVGCEFIFHGSRQWYLEKLYILLFFFSSSFLSAFKKKLYCVYDT